jgi:hypothetical protein
MEDLEKKRSCLERALVVLTQIEANLDTQRRFIGKRKVKGLNRLTRELAILIRTLTGLETELGPDRLWPEDSGLQEVLAAVKVKKRVIIGRSAELLQEAGSESKKIAEEIQRVRQFKKAHRQYANIRFARHNPSFDHEG